MERKTTNIRTPAGPGWMAARDFDTFRIFSVTVIDLSEEGRRTEIVLHQKIENILKM